MARLKLVGVFLLGVLVGVGIISLLGRRATRFAYQSRMEIVLTDANGNEVGSVPTGAILFSSEEPDGADLGFQGYVPISLGTGSEAKVLIVPASALAHSTFSMLNGLPRVHVLHPREAKR